MKNILVLVAVFIVGGVFAQQDSTAVYKKRVLESTEVDFLMSYYDQDGNNAAITGGIGTEDLQDITPTFIVTTPLNDDDVLTAELGFSAYTSASSSNLNPFVSGASSEGDDDDDDDDHGDGGAQNNITKGSPWVAASGASQSDIWVNFNANYAHSSDDRNKITSANISVASEYDYFSIGFGGGFAHLFNEKNTEIGVKANVFLDNWNPQYPTELHTYRETGGDLNAGFFSGKEIFSETGDVVNNSAITWTPNATEIDTQNRNTYALSFTVSQILSKNVQISFFADVVQQTGWLANPMQRVYFADKDNYFMGNTASISNYTSPTNTDVFQLADDIERLPQKRFKLPIGMRFNYYLNEVFSLRTYFRYYTDDWGLTSQTASLEVPIKVSTKFTLYPSYRFYNQSAANYFAPYETHISTSEFYTSDYDLSKFNANQYGFGVSYTDVFTNFHIWKFGLKSIDLKYNNYKRNTGLSANYFAFGTKFILD